MPNDWIVAALAAVAGLDPVLRTLLAGLGILLETSVLVGLVVPGESVVLIASTGIDGWGQWAGMIAAVVVGALCGESIGYAIGRWLGPRAHESRLARRIGLGRLARADAILRRRGGPAIFASRFLPVLHSVVPLAAGMAGMGYRRFLAWCAPAAGLWALLYVSAASAATIGYRELARELHWAGLALVGALALAGLGAWFAKRQLDRLLGAEDAEPAAPAAPDASGSADAARLGEGRADDGRPGVSA